jgi:DNA-binding NarL/FixJ family response regulator
MTAPSTVAIVEDDLRVRESVRQLIDAEPDFRCRGAYDSAEQALRSLGGAPAEILLLDIHLPGMEGSDAARLFHDRFPNMRIVMFTVFEDDRRIFTSLCNGATGYVLKKTPPPKLLQALRDARDGGAPMSSEIALKVVELFRRMRPRELAGDPLTPTEVRLLTHLSEGLSYQNAGVRMQISINTVRDHVRMIYEKLHVHSKSAAVSKALRAGII